MNNPTPDTCPRCHTERLRSWHELDDQQRQLVQRLPASADYTLAERTARHRFCPRCLYEETNGAQRNA